MTLGALCRRRRRCCCSTPPDVGFAPSCRRCRPQRSQELNKTNKPTFWRMREIPFTQVCTRVLRSGVRAISQTCAHETIPGMHTCIRVHACTHKLTPCMHPHAHDCAHRVAHSPMGHKPVQMFAHNYSPLHLAAKRGHLGVCRLLLAANAGPSPFEPRAMHSRDHSRQQLQPRRSCVRLHAARPEVSQALVGSAAGYQAAREYHRRPTTASVH
jgi:hypothetical protein